MGNSSLSPHTFPLPTGSSLSYFFIFLRDFTYFSKEYRASHMNGLFSDDLKVVQELQHSLGSHITEYPKSLHSATNPSAQCNPSTPHPHSLIVYIKKNRAAVSGISQSLSIHRPRLWAFPSTLNTCSKSLESQRDSHHLQCGPLLVFQNSIPLMSLGHFLFYFLCS